MSVLLRSEKGSPLTHSEMDNNLSAVRTLEALVAALGSMSSQNADNVAISGGTIGGVPVASIALGGTAAGIVFVPTGNISATDVQAALAELDTDKSPTGHTHAGYQAASANLDEYAAVNPTAAGLALLDDASADAQLTTLGGTTAGKAVFTAATVAAAQQAIDVEVGVDVQAYDAATAKTNADQTWTGSQRAAPTTDNDLSFDMNAALDFLCTPTAGGALTFTNIAQGQRGCIYLVNGSNYAITAAATTKVTGSLLASISVTGEYWLSYWSPDGTNVLVTHAGDFA